MQGLKNMAAYGGRLTANNDLGALGGLGPNKVSVFTRKSGYQYGWDLAPRYVTSGLWRPVALEAWNEARVEDFHVRTRSTGPRKAQMSASAALRTDAAGCYRIRILLNGKSILTADKTLDAGTHSIEEPFEIPSPRLWYPNGMGEPYLYDVELVLEKEGRELDRTAVRCGVRTVSLRCRDDADGRGRGFGFEINGIPVFCKGSNYVPADAFLPRISREKTEFLVRSAAQANMNMLRVWGGGTYESDDFYEMCDRYGIMVWQDFAMGCAFYPQRDDFLDQFREEVTSVVLKLRNHASLALWAGNNEDDANLFWSRLQPFHLDPNRDQVSRHVIPEVLYEFDGTRPYLPSSPYYSEAVWEKGSLEQYLPENHLWGPRGYYKDKFYTTAPCTFVSEIGYHGCPNRSSLEKMMTAEGLYPWTEGRQWNDEWITKSTRRFVAWGPTMDRNNLMLNQVNILFGSVPDDLDEFVFASQSVQAEAMKYFVEMWRGRKFERTGIIWWNVRDGWPIISDAVVDYYGSKKLAYYFLSNVQKNVCVFVNDPVDGAYPLVAVNDTRHPAEGTVTVTDVATGREVFKGSYRVGANGRETIARLPVLEGQGMLLIRYEADGERFGNHYLYGEPPYDLKEYRNWLDKTKLYANKDK